MVQKNDFALFNFSGVGLWNCWWAAFETIWKAVEKDIMILMCSSYLFSKFRIFYKRVILCFICLLLSEFVYYLVESICSRVLWLGWFIEWLMNVLDIRVNFWMIISSLGWVFVCSSWVWGCLYFWILGFYIVVDLGFKT